MAEHGKPHIEVALPTMEGHHPYDAGKPRVGGLHQGTIGCKNDRCPVGFHLNTNQARSKKVGVLQ